MGVRHLNRFIQQKCVQSPPSRIHLRDFTDKRIAVDASIFLYRFSAEGALLENIYLMASIFRHYNIHAVFVFDGPPPPQKIDLIEKRKKKKEDAKREYERLEKIVKENNSGGNTLASETRDEMEETMRELKKQFVRLRDCDIVTVKELLVSFGFATIDAEGEADVLCASLSIKRRVDACLSDDTDMFVYGCPVVLRSLSLLNHTVIVYKTQDILKSLNLTQHEFKMLCVICGTDYATTTDDAAATATATAEKNPENVYKELLKYKSMSVKETEKYHNSGGGFYDWYSEKHRNPSVSAITYLANEGMFDTQQVSTRGGGGGGGGGPYKQLIVLNRENIHKKRIVEIMTKEDFIFVEASPSDDNIIKSLSNGHTSFSPSPIYNDIVNVGENGNKEEEQARIIAKEVYNIGEDVASFQELHEARRKSSVAIPIKKRKRADDESI